MNKLLPIFLAVAALTGCDATEERQAQQRSLEAAEDEAAIAEVSRETFNKDSEELKTELAKLQATDKSVVDMYYKINSAGDKVLVIVRDVAEEPKEGAPVAPVVAQHQQHTDMAMVNGMMLGMMMSNMSNAGGINNYRDTYPSSRGGTYGREEARRERNTATAGYVSTIRSRSVGAYKSSPSYAAKVTARSNGAFANAGSARSGGYSAGG